jgi:sigma-B regulation protein RsbU (phosphoserine phosphatase)
MKKKSLVKQFTIMFILLMLLTVFVGSVMTFLSQTKAYHRECVQNLQQLTAHLAGLIEKEEEEFTILKEYFEEHPDKVQVPLNFREDLPGKKQEFITYITEHYPDEVFDKTLAFEDLDDVGKQLYINYRFEYWFNIFFDAADEFDLSYVYYIYPVEGKDHTMCYMFDPTLETTRTEDGKEILFLGDKVFEDPKKHKYMWEAWDTGKAPIGFDVLDNEFGHVYTYCQPVLIKGEKAGLMCAEISVDRVRTEILATVLRQALVSIIVLAGCVILLFLFFKKRVLVRIISLEQGINTYSETKDPSVADRILENKGTDDELGELAEKSADMIRELEDYMINLQAMTAERERIGAELNVATQIQTDMLPTIFPPFPDIKEIDLYATMTPAKEVGGDFYDFFMVDDTHLAAVIADVSGKSVPAALFMVITKTLIKNRVQMGETPGEALAHVNEQLLETNDSGFFVTVWLTVIDLKTGLALQANAGHEYPALRRKDGLYEIIHSKHSPAVATIEGIRFRQSEFTVEPGDQIFVYTDGVTEATDANNNLFGEQRLADALNRHPEYPPDKLLPVVKEAIDEFVGDAPQFDDITMLSIRFNGYMK